VNLNLNSRILPPPHALAPATPHAASPHEAALRFLADRIDYERAQSMPCSEEAFKLDRMRELLHRLGDPQNGIPIVHIAGTKAKARRRP